ncbi:MAG: hypothetical protein HQK51_19990 [Oligoflexia bacterium]|nr:hypothetical protein [Oligoflexia bacterium]
MGTVFDWFKTLTTAPPRIGFVKREKKDNVSSQDKLRDYFDIDFSDNRRTEKILFEQIVEGLEKEEAYMLDEDAYNKFIGYGE